MRSLAPQAVRGMKRGAAARVVVRKLRRLCSMEWLLRGKRNTFRGTKWGPVGAPVRDRVPRSEPPRRGFGTNPIFSGDGGGMAAGEVGGCGAGGGAGGDGRV